LGYARASAGSDAETHSVKPLTEVWILEMIDGFDKLLASVAQSAPRLGYVGTWREEAVCSRLLPVYSDWACWYALDEFGEPVYAGDVGGQDLEPLTNRRHRVVVLALAAERYPALAALRPVRQPDDPTCPTCGGTGQPILPPGADSIICECGGLGWIPAGSELGPV
jgi:hypothetical protein